MHILEHTPVTLFSSLGQYNISIFFLTLTHGNISELSIFICLIVGQANLLYFKCRVNTWEKHEECWYLRLRLFIKFVHIKSWLLYVFNTQVISDILD